MGQDLLPGGLFEGPEGLEGHDGDEEAEKGGRTNKSPKREAEF